MLRFLSLAVFFHISPGSGEIITIPLNKTLEIGSGCNVLFEYDLKNRVFVEGKQHSLIPPPLPEGSRAGYGFVYFVGQPQGTLQKQVLFLVTDYDNDRARLFVDGNNNLDLNDDEPCSEKTPDGSFLVRLHAFGKPDHRFAVRLRSFRERPEEGEGFAEFLQPYIQRMGGKATKPRYWFSEHRLNTVAGEAKIGEFSFRIGVNDYDCNGSYSDRESDRILVGDAGESVLSNRLSHGATTLGDETLILVQGRVFEIVEVDSAGKFLKLQASNKLYKRLGPGMSLPPLSIDLLGGEKRDLSSYLKPDRYLLLDFWGVWCQPCIAAIPELKNFQIKWKDRLIVLGLHFGDVAAARRVIEKKGMGWDQAVATQEIQERFLVDSWPFYVLVGPDGRIVQLNTDLLHVEAMLRLRPRRE